jgi:hypothetical protein
MKKILSFAIFAVMLTTLAGCDWFSPKPAADEDVTTSTSSESTATLEIVEADSQTVDSTASLTIVEEEVTEEISEEEATEEEAE